MVIPWFRIFTCLFCIGDERDNEGLECTLGEDLPPLQIQVQLALLLLYEVELQTKFAGDFNITSYRHYLWRKGLADKELSSSLPCALHAVGKFS